MANPEKRGRPARPDVLTLTEWRIVDAVRHAMTNRQIARRRGVSLDAVKYHLANVRAKLGIADRRTLRHWPGVPADSAIARGGDKMADLRLGPIGQISREVADITKAVAWYKDVLGLPHLFTFGTLAFFDCGGVRLFLGEPESGAPPGPESVLYFRVDDIRAAHEELAGRGVEFTDAPHLIHRHDNGMEEWMAFFHDLEGRPLALMSQVMPKG
jgi:DNA-binding CsgD family transcriptional regulator/catechol 2,3-dioxygenase-like lactoylglutathione lyase family enzyme